MKWFLTKIVYRIVCGDGNHTPQFDEQLRLVLASGSAEALEKATLIGIREQDSFYNMKEQLVSWQFVGVPEFLELEELGDGTELYSRVNEVDNADNYMHTVRSKEASLKTERCSDNIYS